MSVNNDLSQLSFPEKLWYLVNEPKCEQIDWGPEGTSIIIPNNQEFTKNVLNNPSKVYFKTKNLSSFVRQLNLYGFRKVSDHRKVGDARHDAVANRSEFKHPCFRRDRKDLLEEVKRHQNNNKKEESPNEEKPYTSQNNIQSYPSYFPVNSMPSPFSMWSNWDPYHQAMGLFPYLPPGTTQGTFAGMPNQAPLQAPGFYNRDPIAPPYGSYLPQYFQMPQCGYDDMSMINTSGINTMVNESKVSDSSSLTIPTVKVTPSKPSVVIINNTLSSSRDVPVENGYYGKCDVSKSSKEGGGDSDADVCRGQEAKKPIPIPQRAGVSTTANSVSVLQDWRVADSLSPMRLPNTGNGGVLPGQSVKNSKMCMQSNDTKIKATAEKPLDKEERYNGSCDKETDADVQRRKKLRLEFNGKYNL